MAKFGIGQAVPRTEDPRLLTGKGRYTDDVVLSGQAAGYILRSPFAHARIASIDVSAAIAAPGVIGVTTNADLAADGVGSIPVGFVPKNRGGWEMPKPARPALAAERVRHVGDPVALIVAETLDQARDAAEMIEVDYETLPVIVDTAGALADEAPRVWDLERGNLVFDWELGDAGSVDAAFAKAPRVVTVDLVNNRVLANPMEGRACLSAFDPESERFTLYVSSQGVHGIKNQLADDIFGLPPEKFHVMTTDVGGGFGMKIFMYPEYIATLHAARKFGRAVKWTADRSEGFVSDDHGRDNVTRAELALDDDGKMLAIRVDTIANLGAYLSTYGPLIPTLAGCQMLTGLYDIPAAYVHVRGVFTNTQPVDAYRGAGRPEAAFVVERIVDAAARQFGIPAPELRRRNYVPPEAMPYDTALGLTYDSGEFARNLDEALAQSGWESIDERRREAKARGKLRGIGLATYVEACGGGPDESARVEISRAGAVTLFIGTQTNGQGHETAYKQIIADYLGIEPEDVTVVQGDSDRIPTGRGTGGSRSIPVGGVAVVNASEKIVERAREQAAELLEAAAADIEVVHGRFTIAGTDRSITLTEIAKASSAETPFDETAAFAPPSNTFPNGAHVCEVEIDPDTGMVDVVNYTVVDDFGTVLNPLMVAGQVYGGIAQGLGQALHECTVYEPESGQLLSGSFMDYTMPRADDLPSIDFRYNEIPCATNPLGIKGAGEAGCIGAPPAAINAVIDALADYGVTHVDMPATPETVWRLIHGQRPRIAAE
ncbi:MAG: xanthine dehydrogenase family protein molybdopterin-binding subunit [Inquilinus sp.]|nr:xanthine dehydrogenase family protein molybdopterin-binding subunit [Inquilinus sp.]